MAAKYNSLEELKRKKALLKEEVNEMEKLLTFDNAKESLSALTEGYSDAYLTEKVDEHGQRKISFNTGTVIKKISSSLAKKAVRKNPIMSFTESALAGGAMDDIIKLGAVALIGSYARKKIGGKGWRNKLLGLALIYVLPIGLRYVRKKLEEYERKKSISSMQQLI